jgi:5'-nucleotidase
LHSSHRAIERTDGALINAGGVRANKLYEDGLVTFADLNRECPFPSENIQILVSGGALSDAVQLSRQAWPESNGMALHGDNEIVVDAETHAVTAVAGALLDRERLYTIVIDSYIVKANDALRAYANEHPERIPPDDAGRPALPILVQYYCDFVWRKLLDTDHDGSISAVEVDALVQEADTSGDGQISVAEVLATIEKRLGGVQASFILAHQCLSLMDKDKGGFVSREELLDFMESFQSEVSGRKA